MRRPLEISVVGGCGHVGLPLSVSLSSAGFQVVAFDISSGAVEKVNSGISPFWEPGLDEALGLALANGFQAQTNSNFIAKSDVVIVIVGTPIDVHLNPDPNAVVKAVEEIVSKLNNDQLLILRSTVFPGVTTQVERLLRRLGLQTSVVFCPERIAEGFAMKELFELPQIIGARTDEDFKRASEVFESLGIKVIHTTPEEAELAKLFTNTWRYIKFAAANQFWMMANDSGVNFENVRNAIRFEYPRASDFPAAGFTAGPCLFKDTMQLAAFSNNTFALGNSAMMINEGLPFYIVERLSNKYDLGNTKVGLLGMAFKGESDDNRSSLAYKLKRILKFKSGGVLTSDPYVKNDADLVSEEEVVEKSDLLIISAPHLRYKQLATDKPIVDIWNLRGEGSAV
ncbi:nucleotide sugar dehydrogenase [Candidatus Planktophila dulcis]|uniref:nucleotide sugar dehydrogenase n=1 Tax=Candidatus Planktophila dulcis TaxID=1884914 RepID=UPI003CF913C0